MNVLLLPDTETAGDVADQLLEWSAARLLRPFCIWTAGDAGDANVRELREGHSVERPLAAALARAEPEAVRFVAFHPAAAGELIDDGFAERVERFLATAAEVLDFFPEDPLTCTMVVAPAAALQHVPPTLFRASWSGLYLAPEDRAQPGAINQLVGDGGRLPRHAGHAAATIAGLWVTPEANRPDLLAELRDAPAGPQPVTVRVVRCFSRAVELGYVADHVAAAAFGAHDGWPRPDSERFERVDEPGEIVPLVARAYLRKHRDTLGPRDFEPVVEDPPPRLGLLEAILKLWALLQDWVRRRPFELAEDVLAWLHDTAAARIEQLSGAHAIRVRRWDELPDHEHGLQPLVEQLEEPLPLDDGAVEATWSDLRRLTLGLVDGSDLPDDVGQEALVRSDRRLLICDPRFLAHDPQETTGADDEGPLLAQIRAGLHAALERAIAHADALAAARAAELSSAAAPPDERGPEAQRRRLARLARRTLLRLLAALAAAVAAWIWLEPLPALVATLASFGVAVATALGDARRTLQRPLLTDDEWAQRELRKLNLALAHAQARGDVGRLRRRCDELDTWIAILAELLYRPWVREPFGALQLPAPVGEDTLPAAFAIAAARPQQATLDRIGARARAYAFRTGWLSTIYRSVTTRTMEEYRLARRGTRPIEPAADTTTDRDSPRKALLTAVLRGDGRRLRDNPLTADLLSAIDGAMLDELAPQVLRTSTGVRALGPTTTWVDAPIGVQAVSEDRADRVVSVGGAGAAGVVVTERLVVTAATAVPDDRELVVATGGGLVSRVHDVQLPEGTGLALLHVEDDLVDASDLPVAERLQRADGVVAIEPAERGVTVRWGYVTRVGRRHAEIVYDGERPALGAPLFDLDGRLVALQGERGAHRVVDADTLLGMKTSSGPARRAAQLEADGEEGELASAFLDAIATTHGSGLLWPRHWTTGTDANAIELALPPGPAVAGVATSIGELTDGAAFMRPLRVMVHRIEATPAVAPDELASCAAQQPSPGPRRQRRAALRSVAGGTP